MLGEIPPIWIRRPHSDHEIVGFGLAGDNAFEHVAQISERLDAALLPWAWKASQAQAAVNT